MFFKKILNFVSLKIVSPFKWTFLKFFFTGRAYDLRPVDREFARDLMKKYTLLWVSRRETHLTTYFISFFDWALSLCAWVRHGFKGKRPRFGFYSHAFFNYDDNELVEAVAKGVQKVFFDDVFDCDAVAALIPKYISEAEWDRMQDEINQELEAQLGKQYDTGFDLKDENAVSCIELVRLVLKKRVPDYELKFKCFETMIQLYGNVTPQMLYESDDFEVVWEVRRN